jgi:predicted Fe-Mo cluster-binding NifX family protein
VKICIPTGTADGKTAQVHAHFGGAPYFTIYDTDKDAVEVVNNDNQHHTHGMCQPMAALSAKGIDVVVCGGMGVRAIQKLNEGGVRAYRAVAGSVAEIAKQFAEGGLEEITADDACREHDCH